MLRKIIPEKTDLQELNMLWKKLGVLHLLEKKSLQIHRTITLT